MEKKTPTLEEVLQSLIDAHKFNDEPYWLGYKAGIKQVLNELQKGRKKDQEKKEKIINWRNYV